MDVEPLEEVVSVSVSVFFFFLLFLSYCPLSPFLDLFLPRVVRLDATLSSGSFFPPLSRFLLRENKLPELPLQCSLPASRTTRLDAQSSLNV